MAGDFEVEQHILQLSAGADIVDDQRPAGARLGGADEAYPDFRNWSPNMTFFGDRAADFLGNSRVYRPTGL